VLIVVALCAADAGAATRPVVASPTKFSASMAVERHGATERLRVYSVRVDGVSRATKPRFSCRRCGHFAGPRPRMIRKGKSVTMRDVHWLVDRTDVVELTLRRRRFVGRLLQFSPRRQKGKLRLVFKRGTCLNPLRIACPPGTPQPPTNQPVAPIPVPVQPVSPPPPPPPPPAPGTPRVCSDGMDNDGDGLVDYPQDLGCRSPNDFAEKHPPCSDGLDNDSDGFVDFPQDKTCKSANGPAEQSPACSDGQDNDGDGKIDYPKDLQCTSATDPAEAG